jgi:hypothetical protein
LNDGERRARRAVGGALDRTAASAEAAVEEETKGRERRDSNP